ncbi:MAG: hypothetical protein IKC07_02990 [Clostridia bacterium]|nr:hypothetical protein [Clostridia bacterium]
MKNTNSPITFGKVLIENSTAMDRYLNLPKYVQENILQKAEKIVSEKEMQDFVNSINNL